MPAQELEPPIVPEDLKTAIKAGKVRAPTHIVSTICDDRGGPADVVLHSLRNGSGVSRSGFEISFCSYSRGCLPLILRFLFTGSHVRVSETLVPRFRRP